LATFLSNRRNLVLVALALSILGAILVVSTPFGGMTVRVPVGLGYEYRDRWASLGSEYAEAVDNAVMSLLVVGMVLMGFFTFTAIAAEGAALGRVATRARLLSLFILGVAVVGGIGFNIIRDESTYGDWWLDTGFYAAVLVGILNSVVYTVLLRRHASERTDDGPPPGEMQG
jgi:hypothetical protein